MNVVFLLIGIAAGIAVGYLLGRMGIAPLAAEREVLKNRLAEQAETMQKQFDEMKLQFQNIAHEVIRDNSSDINKMNTESFRHILDPFREQMNQFREQVGNCYVNEAKERFSLQEEIKRLVAANLKISEDANSLAHALKGDSKVQGDWGEMILDDILAKSGLKAGEQYFKQQYTRNDQGLVAEDEEGKKMRPDVLVCFPDKRKMIIDSKVSLTAYTNYMNTSDTVLADKYLKEHLRSIKNHIDELSRVNYAAYITDAPDFVMMFIPIEPAYSLAMRADATLWDYAYSRKVVLMNPTNLIAALRLSLDLWRRNDQIENLDAIVKIASNLYDKLSLFQESMNKIGNNLSTLDNSYQEAVRRLSEGKGNVIDTAHKLMDCGITPKKTLGKV